MATLGQLEDAYLIRPPAGSGPARHSGNTEIKPLLDGAEYFTEISAAIDACTGAGDLIYIVSWLFHPRMLVVAGTAELGQRLTEKAAAGVDVRIILWSNRLLQAFESKDDKGDIEEIQLWLLRKLLPVDSPLRGFVGIVHANSRAAFFLRNAVAQGAKPLADRVLLNWSGTRGDHSKYTLVKAGADVTAFVGGIDFYPNRISERSHPADPKWHDIGVRVKGGAVADVWADFQTKWSETSTLSPRSLVRADPSGQTITEPFNPQITTQPLTALPAPLPPAGTQTAQVVRSYGPTKEVHLWGEGPNVSWSTLPTRGVQEIKASLAKAIDGALRYIYIEDQGSEYATKTLYAGLVNAANRGVKVIMLSSGQTDPADPGAGATADTLSPEIEDNIVDQIDQFARGNFTFQKVTGITVHSKMVMIDDRFLSVGSANFWDTSLQGVTEEVNVVGVDPGSTVTDFRVAVWADHLAVDPADATVKAELGDLLKSLAIWRKEWGTGIAVPHPNSTLRRVWPP